jgi:hypothetical protein
VPPYKSEAEVEDDREEAREEEAVEAVGLVGPGPAEAESGGGVVPPKRDGAGCEPRAMGMAAVAAEELGAGAGAEGGGEA